MVRVRWYSSISISRSNERGTSRAGGSLATLPSGRVGGVAAYCSVAPIGPVPGLKITEHLSEDR